MKITKHRLARSRILFMEEENRYKVIAIEKYNEIIDESEKAMKKSTFWIGLNGLNVVLDIFLVAGGNNFYSIPLITSSSLLIIYLKDFIKALVRKTLSQQRLMEIEYNLDERIEEVMNTIQTEAIQTMKEEMDGGKKR